jgi:hypothetical protein
MTRKKSSRMPTSDLQWQARKLAIRASKLADRAGPMTTMAAKTARTRGDQAATWARPRVGRMRAWMAVRAERGSVSVQETWAPRMSATLKATARKLDPPKARARRWPKLLAGTALLAAGAGMAAAARSRSRQSGLIMPPRPAQQPGTGASVKVQGQSHGQGQSEGQSSGKQQADADVTGLTRSR